MRLLVLPLRAPLLLLLIAISVYSGMHWTLEAEVGSLTWILECLQAMLVVVVCTMPNLILQRISGLMAASRVVSLVVTLLAVTVGGLYLLHLAILSNVLILACAVLLARLDLVRLQMAPPPLALSGLLTVLVLSGAVLGRWLAG